jgi:hypothetical protein
MSTIAEIEEAIAKLPRQELWQLKQNLDRRCADDWDTQMADDAAAGRLDFLFEEAEADRASGKMRDWPPANQ